MARHFRMILVTFLLMPLASGCYVYTFFKNDDDKSGGGGSEGAFNGAVIGRSIGAKAGAVDDAALSAVYAVASTHAPAAIRPDPDLYVRRMLRQYRDEGVTIARQIGQVEQFRLLLGGATEDFAKQPQDTYDATSLLAVFKVAEEVCRGLVAPNAVEHEGWKTILPFAANQEIENIGWLAQRFIGKPTAKIDPAAISGLAIIMDGEEAAIREQWWGADPYAKYVPVCATLALDAEALYL